MGAHPHHTQCPFEHLSAQAQAMHSVPSARRLVCTQCTVLDSAHLSPKHSMHSARQCSPASKHSEPSAGKHTYRKVTYEVILISEPVCSTNDA